MHPIWCKLIFDTEMKSSVSHYEFLISPLQQLICFLLDFSVSNRKKVKWMGKVSFQHIIL